GWTIISVSTGDASLNAGKQVSFNSSNGVVIVFGLNQTVIASGVVANAVVSIPGSATAGSYPVTISNVFFSDANGNSIAAGTSTNGSIIIPTPKPVITSFTASPLSITSGQSSTLSWTVTGSTSITISSGIGDVTGKTSIVVSPTVTTTYTLTASNSAG